MCAGRSRWPGSRRLYFAAADPKGGAVLHGPRLFAQPTCHHAPEVYSGIGEEEAGDDAARLFRGAALTAAVAGAAAADNG